MKQVEVYSKRFCPYCDRAKSLLKIKGVSFREYDVTDDPEKEREMFDRSGCRSVPVIFVDGQLLGGCDRLFELDEQGGLDELLDLPSLIPE